MINEKSAREAAEKRLHSIERKLEKETQEHAITNENLMLFRESVDLMREKLEGGSRLILFRESVPMAPEKLLGENQQRIELEKEKQDLSIEYTSLDKPDIHVKIY